MTNREKAKELAQQCHKGCNHSKSSECNVFENCENCHHYVTAIQMAKWKDKKALEACEKLLDKISIYKTNVVSIAKDKFIDEFKKYFNEP